MKSEIGMEPEIKVAESDGVMVITLNRPAARNAVTFTMAKGMAAALDDYDRRNDLRVAVIVGAGGTFCSGMDLKGFLRGETPRIEGRGFAGLTERPPKKPLIAAVEGYALAGGFEIALSCDLIVGAANAKFGLPEVKRGLMATAGGLVRLPRQLPQRIAMELAMTGAMVEARRLYECGLINRIVEPGDSLSVAVDLARTISENGPMAVVASKRVILESVDWPSNELFTRQKVIAVPVFESADAKEGALAFVEKRKPVWG